MSTTMQNEDTSMKVSASNSGWRIKTAITLDMLRTGKRKTSSGMTFITTVKNVGQAMFKINCGEGSVTKSSHKGNIINHIH
jgi:hypothetical protein